VKEIAHRHELVKHLAFFVECLPLLGELLELELRRRADPLFQG
jgi:hypothetical protein